VPTMGLLLYRLVLTVSNAIPFAIVGLNAR
jgi:hypothetical protein